MENSLFWFPPEDKGLVGSTTGRDPLGFLAIWSHRGRDIVRNLTEQTRSVAGFQLLLSTFRLFAEFQKKHPNLIDPSGFFMLVEQAFAYSTYHNTKKWFLPGGRRVSAFYNNENGCQLSFNQPILSNQLGNGVWGLYRGAAFRSGLLDDRLTGLSTDVYEHIKDEPVLSVRARDRLFSYIIEAVNSHEKGVVFPTDNKFNLIKELPVILKNIPDKKLLKQYLIPENSPEERIAKLLHDNEDTVNDITGFRTFVELALRELSDEQEAFKNICRCEDFIAPAEAVFYYLFKFSGKSVRDAAAAIHIDFDNFRKVFERFCDSGKYEKGTGTRFTVYRDGIKPSSVDSFITSLLDCHLKVATGRGREPWLVIEGEKLTPYIQFDPPEELDAEPGKIWINDYYLGPLLSIYSELLP